MEAGTTFKIGHVNIRLVQFLECRQIDKWDGKHEKFNTLVVRRSNHDAEKYSSFK